jgi:AraC-like DNA-binding protein
MVSLAAAARLLENAARTQHLPTFGLRLGSVQDVASMGLLAVVIRNTATVHEALRNASRYLFIHSPSYELTLEDPSRHLPDCITLRFDIKLETAVPQRQLIDGFLATTYRMAQLLSPKPIRVLGVSIPHSPTGHRHAYRAHFNAPVSFEQPYAGLHLGREILQASMGGIEPYLREQAVAYIASRHPAAGGRVSGRVRSTLKSTVGANRGTKGQIAELLDLHPRTLQRRLTAEGSSFEQIRTEVYRAATRRLLLETEIPLSQVAAALGFSEQSAMNRSVKRWFDATPGQLRKNGRRRSHRRHPRQPCGNRVIAKTRAARGRPKSVHSGTESAGAISRTHRQSSRALLYPVHLSRQMLLVPASVRAPTYSEGDFNGESECRDHQGWVRRVQRGRP